MLKVTVSMLKEGSAYAKDNRILRKKIVEVEIDSVSAYLEVQKAEYKRINQKLENEQLLPQERAYFEKRAETIADRLHETAQSHQEDIRQNTPPSQKGIPAWEWIGIIAVTGVLCFLGGRYYQPRC